MLSYTEDIARRRVPMKRFLILLILAAMLLLPISVYAAPETIDLETMTIEELNALKNEVTAAITKASSEVLDGYILIADYGEYARNPDPHIGEKIRFNGTVEQVIEGIESTTYRIAMNGNTDNMFYVEYSSDSESPRVLEEDKVTVVGEFTGLTDYDSLLGGQITIPSLTAENITAEIKPEVEFSGTRQDPIPVGATFRYEGQTYYNNATMDITVTSVIRGAAAWDMVKKFNRYNDKPKKNEEYIIASIKASVISSPDDKPVNLDSYDFTFTSADGVAYERSYVSGMTPELKTLYAGAENEGIVATLISKEDKPMLVYLSDSDSPIWFDLNKRKPIVLGDDVVLSTLQKGDSGDGVLAVQQKLVELGYLSGTPDGNFGKKTVEAISKYQTDMGIEATGIADEATQRLILTGQLPK